MSFPELQHRWAVKRGQGSLAAPNTFINSANTYFSDAQNQCRKDSLVCLKSGLNIRTTLKLSQEEIASDTHLRPAHIS